jgi:hypothetical protein
MLEGAGYEILEIRATVTPAEVVIGLPPASALIRALHAIQAALAWLMPGLFGYQFVFLARPAPVGRGES